MKINKSGMTLVELMITLVILVVAGGPIIYMFIMSSRGVSSEAKHFTGMYLTKGLVEKHLEEVYRNPKVVLHDGSFEEPFEDYSYTVEYEPVEDEELLYKVTVTTEWPGKVRNIKYPLSFLISKKYSLRIENKTHTAWDDEYGPLGF
ncbi:MAG: PilW family protein [Candidatus Muiribacteriota bacterium]